MEKRSKKLQKINSGTSEFLGENPEIAKALRLFDVSYEQYRMATEASQFSTDFSANPKPSGSYIQNMKG